MKTNFTVAWAVGLLTFAAGPVSAQPVAQPSTPIGDISGFEGGPQTLLQVIQHVEDMTGGKVIEARFSRREGRGGFDVLTAKGGQVQFLRIARENGDLQLVRTRDFPADTLTQTRRYDLRIARRAAVSLNEAVLTAERVAGGPAVATGLARGPALSDVHAYNVLIDYPDGHTRRIAVDDDSGMVINDPGVMGFE